MRADWLRLLGVALFITLLAAFVTWPQAMHLSSATIYHHDTYFSIWRLGWVAHALATNPLGLFDANIFYPARGTLAYSDAMLAEGIAGAPLLWAGLSPALVYNLLLGVGFVGSGVAMFVLARHLIGRTGPALVSAAAFTLTQYRIEHVMHLELQWTMWIPLVLWALHRTIETGSRRFGVLAGLFLWLQTISCVYYGVFLGMVVAVAAPLMLIADRRRIRQALPALAIGAVVAAILTLPYALIYMDTSRSLGGRDLGEMVRYSARPINYLASTLFSRAWGWTADRWGGVELRLYPGLVTIALAVVSVRFQARKQVAIYGVITATAFAISLGMNNPVYRLLADDLPLLQGLRSTARAAILVIAALSVLAGFGAQALLERWREKRHLALGAFLGLMLLDGAVRPLNVYGVQDLEPAPIYKVIRGAEPGVVLELPLPRLDRLPGQEPLYQLWSMQHWNPLVNGYSGYYPPDYVRTIVKMGTFGDDESIRWLRLHQVRYIVVHRAFYENPEDHARTLLAMASRPEFHSWGHYDDAYGPAELFVLEPGVTR